MIGDLTYSCRLWRWTLMRRRSRGLVRLIVMDLRGSLREMVWIIRREVFFVRSEASLLRVALIGSVPMRRSVYFILEPNLSLDWSIICCRSLRLTEDTLWILLFAVLQRQILRPLFGLLFLRYEVVGCCKGHLLKRLLLRVSLWILLKILQLFFKHLIFCLKFFQELILIINFFIFSYFMNNRVMMILLGNLYRLSLLSHWWLLLSPLRAFRSRSFAS